MTYEELKISIDLNGYKNVLPKIGKSCLVYKYWFVVCDDGDCHLFDSKEDDISKIKEIYEYMIPSDVKKIVIPDSVMSIGDYAFAYCTNLTSVTIPNSVTCIAYSAFYGCYGLTSMTIPNSVTSIGEWAFYNCSGLTSVTIGNSIMSIGKLAFRHCTSLKSLIFKGKSLEQVKLMNNYPFGIDDESIIKCN